MRRSVFKIAGMIDESHGPSDPSEQIKAFKADNENSVNEIRTPEMRARKGCAQSRCVSGVQAFGLHKQCPRFFPQEILESRQNNPDNIGSKRIKFLSKYEEEG